MDFGRVRENFVLTFSKKSFDEIMAMSRKYRLLPKDMVRLGLILVRIVLDAKTKGHQVVIIDKNNQSVKKIVPNRLL